jgi:hypothetical protein
MQAAVISQIRRSKIYPIIARSTGRCARTGMRKGKSKTARPAKLKPTSLDLDYVVTANFLYMLRELLPPECSVTSKIADNGNEFIVIEDDAAEMTEHVRLQ